MEQNNREKTKSKHVKKLSVYDPSWKFDLVRAVMTAVCALISAW